MLMVLLKMNWNMGCRHLIKKVCAPLCSFPNFSGNNFSDSVFADIKIFGYSFVSIFSKNINFSYFKNFFFCQFRASMIFSSRTRIIKSNMTLFAKPFPIRQISLIFTRDIRPLVTLCNSRSAIRTNFRFTQFSSYPRVKSAIFYFITFPRRVVFIFFRIVHFSLTFIRMSRPFWHNILQIKKAAFGFLTDSRLSVSTLLTAYSLNRKSVNPLDKLSIPFGGILCQ